jgi:hypothetical protein
MLAMAGLAPCASPALALPISDDTNSGNDYLPGLTGQQPGLELIASTHSIEVTEGGATANVTVRLAAQPDAVVLVTPMADVPSPGPDRQVRAAPTSSALEFSPEDWMSPRSITVTAIDDEIVEQGTHTSHITLAVLGPDGEVLASVPVEVRITDNDRPSVIVNQSGESTATAEGAESDTLEIRLGTRPSANVTISFELGAQLDTSEQQLVFTPQNWSSFQTLRVGAVQDIDVEGDQADSVRFVVHSTDPGYDGGNATPAAVSVAIGDDDKPGVVVTPSNANTKVFEGGDSDDYTVKLDHRPTSTVRIAIEPGEDVQVEPASLEFSPDSWNAPKPVRVSAIDDEDEEPKVEKVPIRHVVDGDQFWRAVKAPVLMVGVSDNDAAAGDEEGGVYDDSGAGGEDARGDRAGRVIDNATLLSPSIDNGPAPAAGSAARSTSRARGSGGRFQLPELATPRRPVEGTRGAAASTAPGGVPVHDGTRVEAREAQRQAPPRDLQEWYSRNWKLTVPATAAGALGLGGVLMGLMSDGGGIVGRRRLW